MAMGIDQLLEENRQLSIQKQILERENRELREEVKRLKDESESYIEITEMAGNDYTMMQACEFAEWATTYYVTFDNKTWRDRFAKFDIKNEYIKTHQLYDLFLKQLITNKK
jgi:hypothetical protein